ncbi:MAG TPA: cysteine dioxygenase family protein [Oleiagrimonas sp.]|nr:cysteine dioxygenase family protein [Oleiagrimonas sp.]
MLAIPFPGSDQLVATLDRALRQGPGVDDVTDTIRRELCRLMRDDTVQLPACVFEPNQAHYARRELYRSESYGYAVTAMTWAPGQSAPIHDHHGLWCVEGVWHGALEITQYELIEHASDRYRLNAMGTIEAGTGSAGSLIPPHEYHAIGNPSRRETAVSLHVYSAPMTRCSVFVPTDGSWYRRDEKQLSLDRVN